MSELSVMTKLGTGAPEFALPDVVSGNTVTLGEMAGPKALLVVFLCRHCPYVVHVKDELAKLRKDYDHGDLAMVGISSNDAVAYPADAPESLAEFAQQNSWDFPVLYDESQDVGRAYGAVCTPDFFLYGADRKLVYRGRLDDTRPNSGRTPTGADLRAAIDAVLAGSEPSQEQSPSIGCSIKWRE